MKLEECTARAFTSKLYWCACSMLCVAHACGLSGFLFVQFLLVCVAMSRGFCVAMLGAKCGPRNERARKSPAAPPRGVLPAELNCRGACETLQFVRKREFVSWACMVDGSHKRRERGCFLATEIPPCRTPMSPNWVMDVRNRLISPRQFQRTIKRAVSY